ncbi:Type I restriction modification DNA specificity domain protein [uncultured archaeon]|nr:Type I restriction modification DNA specificity domain protein [uncultured archaeon]
MKHILPWALWIPGVMTGMLLGGDDPYLAKVVYADFHGACTSELLVLKPNSASDGKFLFYQLISADFINLIDSMTYGIKMPRANGEQVANVNIPLPLISEQRAISLYLDDRTRKIDSLIKKKQKMIELLKEERAAVINRQ